MQQQGLSGCARNNNSQHHTQPLDALAHAKDLHLRDVLACGLMNPDDCAQQFVKQQQQQTKGQYANSNSGSPN